MIEKIKYNEKFMQRAVELSQLAYKSGKGLPIGCVIVKDNKIIGEGHNEIFFRTNPTAHGEMVAIENACKNLESLSLSNCIIYTTLEPCPMCLAAIYWSNLKAIYFANTNEFATQIGFSDSFIFNEIKLDPKERKIPMFNNQNKNAKIILKEWNAEELPAEQPWKQQKSNL